MHGQDWIFRVLDILTHFLNSVRELFYDRISHPVTSSITQSRKTQDLPNIYLRT